MVVQKIYFDMDSVLADFERGVRELCGMTPPSQNGVKNAKADDEMWDRIRMVDHFYDRLEMMPGSEALFHALYEEYGDECEILTGIPKEKRHIKDAGEDKTRWVHRLLRKDIKVNIVYREDKKNYCTGPPWQEYIRVCIQSHPGRGYKDVGWLFEIIQRLSG